MIYVKALVVCDAAPGSKHGCKAKQNYDVPIRDDYEEPSLPPGWGRYLTRVLCPRCADEVRKMYHPTAVTS